MAELAELVAAGEGGSDAGRDVLGVARVEKHRRVAAGLGERPARAAATGVPQAIASRIGGPKPSYRLGKTRQAARR